MDRHDGLRRRVGLIDQQHLGAQVEACVGRGGRGQLAVARVVVELNRARHRAADPALKVGHEAGLAGLKVHLGTSEPELQVYLDHGPIDVGGAGLQGIEHWGRDGR